MTSRNGPQPEPDPPTRVSTLELFFDLVFVFTITQLTGMLAEHVTLAAAGRVLLIFGLLWWMHSGYVWLSNARTPSRTPERLLVLLGMVGFLIVGLAIPHAFGAAGERGRDGLALGLGYLLVVAVHSGLYLRTTTARHGRWRAPTAPSGPGSCSSRTSTRTSRYCWASWRWPPG